MQLNETELRIIDALRNSGATSKPTQTFGTLYRIYFERHAKVRLRCPDNVLYFDTVHGDKWRDMPVDQISRMDVQDWVDELA
ncbi:MAG: hypothetical protein K2Z81_13645, partial [Cyanobacteria bacterium]|nr:hypothetical protein [Cyanobacteriota bacterium]